MLKHRNKGSIEIVLILLIIITISSFFLFRSILSDQIVIKNTYNYLQYTNCLQSTKDLFIDKTIDTLGLQEFNLQRDIEVIEGVEVYSDYYLPAYTSLNISNLISSVENDESFMSNLDISNIEFISLTFPTEINDNDIFSFLFIKQIPVMTEIQVFTKNFNQTINVGFTLNVEISKEIDKAVITNITIQNEYFKQQ